MITYKFDADVVSRAGAVKEVNEDSCTILRHDRGTFSAVLVAVADGVGGLQEGENASRIAIAALENWWADIAWTEMPGFDELMDGIVDSVKQANGEIIRLAREKHIQMGTTLSCLLLRENEFRIFHVGDSRIYRINKGLFGSVEQLTEDHVAVMPKEVNGEVVEKPFLTECLGHKDEFNYQLAGGTHQTKESYLVCSDGIYKTLEPKKIASIMRREPYHPEKAAHDLTFKAEMNGERDNLTAAVVRIID